MNSMHQAALRDSAQVVTSCDGGYGWVTARVTEITDTAARNESLEGAAILFFFVALALHQHALHTAA